MTADRRKLVGKVFLAIGAALGLLNIALYTKGGAQPTLAAIGSGLIAIGVALVVGTKKNSAS